MNPVKLAMFVLKHKDKLKPGQWDPSMNGDFCKDVLGIDIKGKSRATLGKFIKAVQTDYKGELGKYGADGKSSKV